MLNCSILTVFSNETKLVVPALFGCSWAHFRFLRTFVAADFPPLVDVNQFILKNSFLPILSIPPENNLKTKNLNWTERSRGWFRCKDKILTLYFSFFFIVWHFQAQFHIFKLFLFIFFLSPYRPVFETFYRYLSSITMMVGRHSYQKTVLRYFTDFTDSTPTLNALTKLLRFFESLDILILWTFLCY